MEDVEILELYIKRDEKALVETSNKYGLYLFKICRNILNTKQDSEECVNDTYHTAWKKIPPDKPLKFLAYLGRIAKNIALNKYDYITADKRNTHFDTTLNELEDILSKNEDIMDNFSEKELSSSISCFLRNVNEKQRNIFVRRYWYNDSVQDISDMFGISSNNAKVILHRLRNDLKTHLEKEGYVI